MHARTWLSVASLPLVAAFTLPVLQQGGAPRPAPHGAAKAAVQDPLAGLSDIQDVLGLVQQNYVDRPDMEKVLSGGVQAVLERAHPLNAYLSAEDLRLPDPGPATAGLVVLKRGIYATVMGVVPGGPAAKAGVQPGDVIRKVDGDSVGLLSAWALERKLRGKEGASLDLYRHNASGDLVKTTVPLQVPIRAAVTVRATASGVLVSLPDLAPGRAAEVSRSLATLDRHQPVVLDLRNCWSGSMDEAAILAGVLGAKDAFGTLQEAGKPERLVSVPPASTPGFGTIAILMGRSTLGASEVLTACLKKGGARCFGDRTPGLAVERARFLLKQGGAVELVNRRWLGAGGEKLDRQGVTAEQALRLAEGEDPLAKALTLLTTPPPPPKPVAEAAKPTS